MIRALQPETRRRQAAERRGRRAEAIACLLLRLKGYRIMARRLKTPVGEIDIVARRGGMLAMVEVKARADRNLAGGSITAKQQRRISRAAAAMLAVHPEWAGLEIRFDAMLFGGRRLPCHLRGVWLTR